MKSNASPLANSSYKRITFIYELVVEKVILDDTVADMVHFRVSLLFMVCIPLRLTAGAVAVLLRNNGNDVVVVAIELVVVRLKYSTLTVMVNRLAAVLVVDNAVWYSY